MTSSKRWTYGFDELAGEPRALPRRSREDDLGFPRRRSSLLLACSRTLIRLETSSGASAVDMQSQGTVRCRHRRSVDDGQPRCPRRHATPPPDGRRPAFRRRWGIYDLINEEMQKSASAGKSSRCTATALPRQCRVCLRYCAASKVKGIWIQTSNGIACMSCETERWYEAMKKVEFVAACDIFMTPTIQRTPILSCLFRRGLRSTPCALTTTSSPPSRAAAPLGRGGDPTARSTASSPSTSTTTSSTA